MDDWYVIAINNHRFESLRDTVFKGAEKLWESDIDIAEYIVNYIKEQKTIAPETDHNWSITPTYLLYNAPALVNDYATLDELRLCMQDIKGLLLAWPEEALLASSHPFTLPQPLAGRYQSLRILTLMQTAAWSLCCRRDFTLDMVMTL